MFSESDLQQLKIGLKEVLSVISSGHAKRVIIAEDCDEHIITQLKQATQNAGLVPEYAQSRKALGKACGIDVSASCAAVLK